jgi:hypothetical protein
MSETDHPFQERDARRTEQERQRRQHRDIAAGFLAEYFEQDVRSSSTLAARGIVAHLIDNRLLVQRTDAGVFVDPFVIAVGENGEIDVAGRSLGRYSPDDKVKLRRELTAELLTFFDL